MTTVYPASIDNGTSLPTLIDNISSINAGSINIIRDTAIAIETALGVNPQGVHTTVRMRLDYIEGLIGGIGGVTFSGDISGNDISQTVVGIHNIPASVTSIQAGQPLIYNGTFFTPSTNFAAQNITTTGDGYFSRIVTTGDGYIGGNLTVAGTTTTVDSTVVDIEARVIHVNYATVNNVPVPSLISGVEAERGDTGGIKRDAAAILWSETNQWWQFAFQTQANNSGIGSDLAIKSSTATFSGLAGNGTGLVGINNAGLISFESFSSLAGSVTLAGDVSGAANANTVDKWKGKSLDAATMGSPTDGYIPQWVNAANKWEAKPTTAQLTNVVTLEQFGAVGDGVTNDSAAMTAALAAVAGGGTIQLGAKTYLISGSAPYNVPAFVCITGYGDSSVIKTTTDNAVFIPSGDHTTFLNFKILGSGALATSQIGIANQNLGAGAGTGFHWMRIDGMTFDSLGAAGVLTYQIPAPIATVTPYFTALISNSRAWQCGRGLWLLGEYSTVSGIQIDGCGVGIECEGGNQVYIGGTITACTTGFKLDGGGNDAHGVVCGMEINHNTTNIFVWNNEANGEKFVDCMIYSGDILLQSTHAVQFIGCHIDINNYYFDGSIGTVFDNCTFPQSAGTNTIHNNYNSHASTTRWASNNVDLNGIYPGFIIAANDGTQWQHYFDGYVVASNMAGFGDGYAAVDNSGKLHFTSGIASGSISPGTAGQIFVTNSIPSAAWTSLLTVDPTTGATAINRQSGTHVYGGLSISYSGTINALLGSYDSNNTGGGALWLGPVAISPGATNFTILGDATGNGRTIFNAPATGTFEIRAGALNSYLSIDDNANTVSFNASRTGSITTIGYNGGVGASTTTLSGSPVSIQSYQGGGAFNIYCINMNLDWGGTLGGFVSWDVNNIAWHNSATAPILWQYAAVTDVATVAMTVQAQNAFASAATHTKGGALNLLSGAGSVSGTYSPGSVNLALGSYVASISDGFYFGDNHTTGGYNNSAFFGWWDGAGGTLGALWFSAAANPGNQTTANYAFLSDGGSYTILNAPTAGTLYLRVGNNTGSGQCVMNSTDFYAGGNGATAPINLDWTVLAAPLIRSGTSATSLTVGTNNTGATFTMQAGAASNVMQFAAGTQLSVVLGSNLATAGHIRTPESFIWTARNNANNNDIILWEWSTDDLRFGATNVNSLAFLSANQIAFEAGSYAQIASSTVYLATAGGLSTIQLTANATTSTINFIQCTNATMTLAAAASDVATGALTFQGQYAFASATGTNRKAGNVIVDVGPPTNSFTGLGSESVFEVSRNTTAYFGVGASPASPSAQAALWLGPGVDVTDHHKAILIGDGSTFSYMNVPTNGSLAWIINDATFVTFATATDFYFGGTTSAAPIIVDWTTSTTPLIQSGTAATSLTVGTNKSGASLILQAGATTTLATFTSTTSSIGVTTGTNTLTGALIETKRSSSSSFTLDNTTTDRHVFITATQTVTLDAAAHTAGRRVTFWVDTTSTGSNGSDITLTIAQAASEKINGTAASWVVTVPGSPEQVVRFEMIGDGTNLYITG